jgi:ABC-2 type transport system permease protein
MKRALLITLNEVRLFIQDKGELAFGLLLPIVTFALMYGAFGGTSLFAATASVVNEDRGEFSKILITQLDQVQGVSVEQITLQEANRKLDRSDLTLALYIPAGFSDALANGGQAELTFMQRGNGGQDGQILASIIRGVAEGMNQELQAAYQAGIQVKNNPGNMAVSQGQIKTTVAAMLNEEKKQPTVAVKEEVTGGSPDFVNQYVPGIITMYVLFSLTISARAIVEERKRGTLERLLTTRLSVGELFSGKYLAGVGRGMVQSLILLGLSYAILQVFTPLSFLSTVLIILVYTAAASALGMVIASIARSEDAAVWIGVVFTMVTTMLGGTFFTVEPGSLLATVGKFSINTFANNAVKTVINSGGSLAGTGQAFIVLIGVIIVGLVVSRLVFRAVPGGK